ncbi:MAG: hypothetical protein KA998_04525 [Rickettsiaceae bacterium]|nr:hypothetical protein [Rickettsiaceae bacterium]
MADENTTPNGPLPTATPIEPENETLEEKGIWSECWDKITTLYEKYKRERELNPISDTIIADLNDAFSPKMDEAHEGVEPVDLDETPRIKPAEKFTFGALVMGILGAIGTAFKESFSAIGNNIKNTPRYIGNLFTTRKKELPKADAALDPTTPQMPKNTKTTTQERFEKIMKREEKDLSNSLPPQQNPPNNDESLLKDYITIDTDSPQNRTTDPIGRGLRDTTQKKPLLPKILSS